MRSQLIVHLAWCALAACERPGTDGGTTDRDVVGSDVASDARASDVAARDAGVLDGGDAADAGAPDARTDASAADAAVRDAGGAAYNAVVLADGPVAFWALAGAASGAEPDLTGHAHTGTYRGGTPTLVAMPNGDPAADFDGSSEYLTVPSSAAFSIPTTHQITWEAWIRPDVLQFPHESNGYVDFMGKCASYGPTCEWEARMYDLANTQHRVSRISAYVFNPTAGLGSAADWQPAAGVIAAGAWHHVVGEYQTLTQPAGCAGPQLGGITVYVDGVAWDMAAHVPTGCMSQYGVDPVANGSPVNIGTMARDTWFAGAIGKVAIYDRLLTPAQLARHFTAMTGRAPAGTCGETCTLGP